jgi:hypothetical protein
VNIYGTTELKQQFEPKWFLPSGTVVRDYMDLNDEVRILIIIKTISKPRHVIVTLKTILKTYMGVVRLVNSSTFLFPTCFLLPLTKGNVSESLWAI